MQLLLEVGVATSSVAVLVKYTVGEDVTVGVGDCVGVGGTAVGRSWSLPCTLLGYITPANTQPAARTMIIRMIKGNQYFRTFSE